MTNIGGGNEREEDPDYGEELTDFLINRDEENTETVEKSLAEELGVMNVAGVIESSIERNKKFDCGLCADVFESNVKIDSRLFVKNKKKCYSVCEHI